MLKFIKQFYLHDNNWDYYSGSYLLEKTIWDQNLSSLSIFFLKEQVLLVTSEEDKNELIKIFASIQWVKYISVRILNSQWMLKFHSEKHEFLTQKRKISW